MKRGVIPGETCLKSRPLDLTSGSSQERPPFSRPQPGIWTPLTITLHGAHRPEDHAPNVNGADYPVEPDVGWRELR